MRGASPISGDAEISLIGGVADFADCDRESSEMRAKYSLPLATAGTARTLTTTSTAATLATATGIFIATPLSTLQATDGTGDQGAVELIGIAAGPVCLDVQRFLRVTEARLQTR
jgi:hypothetical protein